MKSMYYSTWIFVDLGAIFRIFETCPKRSLGTPEKLRVVSSRSPCFVSDWQWFLKISH